MDAVYYGVCSDSVHDPSCYLIELTFGPLGPDALNALITIPAVLMRNNSLIPY